MENQKVEYKSNWQDSYLKTIAAFANTEGGKLYIGIDDNGNVVPLKDVYKLLEDIPNKIKNHLGIIPKVFSENNGSTILIEVEPSDDPISYDGKFYIRSGATTQEVKGNELINFLIKKKNLSWDTMLSDMPYSELDEEAIHNFVKMSKKRINISESDSVIKILNNLELIRDNKLTNAAVLLFGKNPSRYINVADARVGRFKTQTEILDTVEAKGNLFKEKDILFDAVKKHLNVKFVIKGELEREDIWDYPLDAIREGIINALIHRDYLDSADIQIKVYDDKIWIWNPGKLPDGISIDMLKKEHSSKPRNRFLALTFYYAGLIEKWGSGTKRMVDLCVSQGLPEPEFKEEFGGVSVYFYKDMYSEENLLKMKLNERQIKAVRFIKENKSINLSSFRALIPEVSEKTLYRDLQELVKKGLLKEIGEKKGRKYELV
ncbi:MAG TPA: ATP-binding protein [Spirochaetales bacterium]|nr:ATP-binding protein [Spirochaetales bacterium]